MSITKSYNRRTNTYYAYETSYEWDEAKQKKVQKRRCIGQFDPETGKIIPNGKVGRPSVSDAKMPVSHDKVTKGKGVKNAKQNTAEIKDRVTAIESRLRELSGEAISLGTELKELADNIRSGS